MHLSTDLVMVTEVAGEGERTRGVQIATVLSVKPGHLRLLVFSQEVASLTLGATGTLVG